jgi:hypothetical protein
MRKKVWLAILLMGVLGLVAQAAVTVTTAAGGADTFVGNDASTRPPTANYGGGTTMDIRCWIPDVRAHIGYVKFDIGGIAGNMTGVQFQFYLTGADGARTWNIYGLNDNAVDDAWGEMTITYNNAPGMLPAAPGNYLVDTTKLTLLGTVAVPNATGLVTSATATLNMDSFIANDTNGLITLVIISGDTSGKQFYVATKEYITYSAPTLILPNAVAATVSTPQPAAGAILPSYTLSQLSWTYLRTDMEKCDVYFGTEPNMLMLQKLSFQPTVSSVNINSFPGYSVPLPDGTYYWRVDCYKGEPNMPIEPNFPGRFWKFTTTSLPLFTLQPVEQIKSLTETAEFTIAVDSGTPVTYAWYHSQDKANNTLADDVQVGTDSATLTLANLTGTDEGYYYCKATNSNGSSYSNPANLGVKRLIAHWTLDGLVGGQYADVSGENHNADPNGTPVFAAGANPAVTGNGVLIDAANGYASSGAWNPTEHTRQMTISLWTKWAGQPIPATWQGLIAKENTFGAAAMMWQLEVDQTNNNLALKSGNSTVNSTPLPVGTWIHLVVTYDGTTARIYRDAIADGSGTFVLGFKTDAPVLIGASSKAADTGFFYSLFNGELDDIQIFSYPLTWNQIIDLYHPVTGQNICISGPTRDMNGDCLVNLTDFAMMASDWLQCGLYPLCP